MDVITEAWKADPGMHVYHFNHYEPTAFKKLASRYVTRVEALNELLRNERFVDLYPIVRAGRPRRRGELLHQADGAGRRLHPQRRARERARSR